MNAHEERWWRRFKLCVQAMPNTLEVVVGSYGSVDLVRRGAFKMVLDRDGDADAIGNEAFAQITSCKGLVAFTEGV